MSAENIENIDELGISDRGVGVQAAGFAVVAFVSLAILQLFSGSEYWLYEWFRDGCDAAILGRSSCHWRRYSIGGESCSQKARQSEKRS